MSIETRHVEKEMLFDLLTLSKESQERTDIKKVVRKLMAKMEQEDVEVVKEHIHQLEENK